MKRSPTKHNFPLAVNVKQVLPKLPEGVKSCMPQNFTLGVMPMPRLHKTSKHVFTGSEDVGKLLRGLLIDAEYEAVMEYIVSLERALKTREEVL